MSTHAAQPDYSADHAASTSSSTTPTRASHRHQHHPAHAQVQHQDPPSPTPLGSGTDFMSPSAYLSHEAFHSQPGTPHGAFDPSGMGDLHYGLGAELREEGDEYSYAYPDFSASASVNHAYGSIPAPVDHSTPSAPTRLDDDRTPIISDAQRSIAPSSLPGPPNLRASDLTRDGDPLLSPFRAYHGHAEMTYSPAHEAGLSADPSPSHMPVPGASTESHTLIDPSAMFYHHYPMPIYDGSPHDPAYMQMPLPPHFIQMPPPMVAQAFPGQHQHQHQHQHFYPPHPAPLPTSSTYAFDRPQSRNGSPSSSVDSSIASLARSASTSSELRPARPKVKLTVEDKRNIVELHHANSSLRQEDIARQYGVDRSTISKIILSADRWTQPQEAQAPSAPKASKTVGGRFPAIEALMDQWMDKEIAAGRDVRDNVAREQAKAFAREIGFPLERFKASAKWLDKFKDRRKAAGKPTTSPMHLQFGYYPYGNAPYPTMSTMDGSVLLTRSHSTMTLSSSDSSGQDQYHPSPAYLPVDRVGLTRSESDLTHIEATPMGSRQRSQSSPQIAEQGGLSPSSGKAMRIHRPSPLNLQRQNSYHGSSPSPRRPAPPSRANSSQGAVGLRRSRPTSLAASAFGITPLGGDELYSPTQSSPSLTMSSSGTHSRQRSDVSLGFSNSMSGMTISPDMSPGGPPSSSGNGQMPIHMTIPPLTPITPGHVGPQGAGGAGGGVFPNLDYVGLDNDLGGPGGAAGGGHVQYATMPNKHYGGAGGAGMGPASSPYVAYPATDFGPVYVPHHQHPPQHPQPHAHSHPHAAPHAHPEQSHARWQ